MIACEGSSSKDFEFNSVIVNSLYEEISNFPTNASAQALQITLGKLISDIQRGRYDGEKIESLCVTLSQWWATNFRDASYQASSDEQISSPTKVEDVSQFLLHQIYATLSDLEGKLTRPMWACGGKKSTSVKNGNGVKSKRKIKTPTSFHPDEVDINKSSTSDSDEQRESRRLKRKSTLSKANIIVDEVFQSISKTFMAGVSDDKQPVFRRTLNDSMMTCSKNTEKALPISDTGGANLIVNAVLKSISNTCADDRTFDDGVIPFYNSAEQDRRINAVDDEVFQSAATTYPRDDYDSVVTGSKQTEQSHPVSTADESNLEQLINGDKCEEKTLLPIPGALGTERPSYKAVNTGDDNGTMTISHAFDSIKVTKRRMTKEKDELEKEMSKFRKNSVPTEETEFKSTRYSTDHIISSEMFAILDPLSGTTEIDIFTERRSCEPTSRKQSKGGEYEIESLEYRSVSPDVLTLQGDHTRNERDASQYSSECLVEYSHPPATTKTPSDTSYEEQIGSSFKRRKRSPSGTPILTLKLDDPTMGRLKRTCEQPEPEEEESQELDIFDKVSGILLNHVTETLTTVNKTKADYLSSMTSLAVAGLIEQMKGRAPVPGFDVENLFDRVKITERQLALVLADVFPELSQETVTAVALKTAEESAWMIHEHIDTHSSNSLGTFRS